MIPKSMPYRAQFRGSGNSSFVSLENMIMSSAWRLSDTVVDRSCGSLTGKNPCASAWETCRIFEKCGSKARMFRRAELPGVVGKGFDGGMVGSAE